MDTALVAIAAVLAIAAIALGVAWRRALADGRRRAAAAEQARERDGSDAQQRIASLEAQLSQLQERLREVEPRTWLQDFPADAVFALVARDEADVDGRRCAFGLVRGESGTLAPFVSERRMGHLAPGDCFVAVRGQLVKLDPDELAASPPAAAAAPSAPAPAPAPTPAPASGAAHAGASPVPDAAAAPAARARALDPDATVPAAADDRSAPAADADRTVFLSPSRDARPEDPDAGLPYLEVIAGPDQGKRFALPFTGASIGRDAGNVVALGDGGASRVHCRIDYRDNGFVLRDNDSTNGTLCNDALVREHALAFGDVIQVADTRLRLTCEGHELRSTDPVRAAAAFEQCLQREPDFVPALKSLAFLLERDVARKKDAQPVWDRLARLERER